MEMKDIEYVLTNISDMCGVPARIYKRNEMVFFHSLVNLIKDPALLDIDKILNINNEVGYFISDNFYNYATLRYVDYMLILGPFRLISPEEIVLAKMAMDLNLSKEESEVFIESMKLITNIPLETVVQSLCMLNFILNSKKLSVKDILIDDITSLELERAIQNKANKEIVHSENEEYGNNSYAVEQEIYKMVEHGDVETLKKWANEAPAIRPGIVSKNLLRQAKNTFIVATTLVSRSAIKGHLDIKEALNLSDLYIQKMETMQNISEINSLQFNMVLDYTERVKKIRGKKDGSGFLISLNKYIISHITEAIKAKDICDALYISKSALFDKIKKETGMTLSDYINSVKISEAKSLLRYSSRSNAAISVYLGFSSQSHFNHTFKKFTGMTPLEYKKKHQ